MTLFSLGTFSVGTLSVPVVLEVPASLDGNISDREKGVLESFFSMKWEPSTKKIAQIFPKRFPATLWKRRFQLPFRLFFLNQGFLSQVLDFLPFLLLLEPNDFEELLERGWSEKNLLDSSTFYAFPVSVLKDAEQTKDWNRKHSVLACQIEDFFQKSFPQKALKQTNPLWEFPSLGDLQECVLLGRKFSNHSFHSVFPFSKQWLQEAYSRWDAFLNRSNCREIEKIQSLYGSWISFAEYRSCYEKVDFSKVLSNLRNLLLQKKSSETWLQILLQLFLCPQQPEMLPLVDYIEQHTKGWEPKHKVFPKQSWMQDFQISPTSSLFALCKSLEITTSFCWEESWLAGSAKITFREMEWLDVVEILSTKRTSCGEMDFVDCKGWENEKIEELFFSLSENVGKLCFSQLDLSFASWEFLFECLENWYKNKKQESMLSIFFRDCRWMTHEGIYDLEHDFVASRLEGSIFSCLHFKKGAD